MTTDYTFQGWLGLSPEAREGKMEWGTFEPKVWQEDDVDIQITHCGVCGSDLHTLGSGWGETLYRKDPYSPQNLPSSYLISESMLCRSRDRRKGGSCRQERQAYRPR